MPFKFHKIQIAELFRSFRGYTGRKLHLDLTAALTIAFVALPQSMAYALIAGVEPQYGIYGFITGAIVGSLLGSSRHLQTGPTNASSIIIASTLVAFAGHQHFMGVVFLLSFLAGLFQFLAGFLRLGKILHFISRSVLIGFIAGAGLSIIVNQLPNLLGMPHPLSDSIINGIQHIIAHLHQGNPLVMAVGIGTPVLALLLNWVSPKSAKGVPLIPSYLVAILAAAAVVAFGHLDVKGVKVIGEVSVELLPLSSILLDWHITKELLPGAVALAIIGITEAYSSAKSTAAFSRDRINADQEFIGQGAAKMLAAFFSGMPVSGSPSRTLLCFRAGAVSKLANILAGIFVAIIALVCGGLLRYIPVAALAGILMLIAGGMMNWKQAKLAVRATRADAIAMLATFASAIFLPLVDAIYIGVGLSIALFLKRVRTPRLVELEYDERFGFHEVIDEQPRSIPEISVLNIDGDVFFGSADFLEEEFQMVASRDELLVLILNLKRSCCLDATSIMTLKRLYEDMRKHDKVLLISGANPEVARVLRRSGLAREIGEENIFLTEPTLLLSTRSAFAHALEFVKLKRNKEYKIDLFLDFDEKLLEHNNDDNGHKVYV